MKPERIVVRHVRLPLRHPFETSFGRTEEKRFLLVSVSADGVSGHAECVADEQPHYLPETNGTVLHVMRDFLAPLVLGRELAHPREVEALFAPIRGNEMAKAAIEMAIWELYARRSGQPLSAALGGSRGEIEAGVSIGLQSSTDELLAKVELERAAGYRKIKIKIKPGSDVDLVAAVRERFGDIPLMVDANSAYSLADVATLRRLDAHRLMMIEQPLEWCDIIDHAELQRRLETPVCLDESIRSLGDARRAVDLGACRVINVKVGRVGGFGPALAIDALARERGLPLWCGGMLESGVGRLANVHLQTLAGFTLPGDTSASERYFDEDLVDPPITVSSQGTIQVPTGPGIGHEIVWPRVERATLLKEEWRT